MLPCRETQLRAFYSTTEEISSLFAKQQQRLKAMQKTLEDEENYSSDSAEIDLNIAPDATMRNCIPRKKQLQGKSDDTGKARSHTSGNKCSNIQADNSSDDACGTEKHDCDHNTQDDLQNTQEVDSGNVDTHLHTGICGDTYDGAPVFEGQHAIGTEQVSDTESPEADNEHCYDSDKEVILAGETMQVDDETRSNESEEFAQDLRKDPSSNNEHGSQGIRECTDTVAIKTQDLLASEAASSWACSTPPAGAENNNEGPVIQHDSNTVVADSQHSPTPESIKRRKNEREELSEMIGIVAPELKDHFCNGNKNEPKPANNRKELPTTGSDSNSDTEGIGSEDNQENNDKGRVMNDSETDESDGDEYSKSGEAMDEDEQEDIEHDSVG